MPSNTKINPLHRMIGVFSGRPYVLLVFTMLAWGGNAVAGRASVGEVSPMVLTALRWAIVLGVLALSSRRQIAAGWPAVRAQWPAVLVMGAGGYTVFNALYFTAAHHTTAVNLSIIQGALPVFVLLGALALHRTPIRLGQALGMAVTLAGIAVVASKGDVHTLARLRFNVGDLMMLACCALYAGFTLALRGRPNASGVAFFSGLAVAAFVTSLPLVGFEALTHQLQWPTAKGWGLLVYIAVLPTALAQMSFMRAVALIGPGRAGLFINLVPIFGALLAVLILREPFGLHHAAALALVLAGILLAETSARRG
ncbi:MAG: DMT family transporter [Caulobacteraceae bacterium]